jgi:hypothetical protein
MSPICSADEEDNVVDSESKQGTLRTLSSWRRLMTNPFFDHPLLTSPYVNPLRDWALDGTGQPTQQIVERRRLGRSQEMTRR